MHTKPAGGKSQRKRHKLPSTKITLQTQENPPIWEEISNQQQQAGFIHTNRGYARERAKTVGKGKPLESSSRTSCTEMIPRLCHEKKRGTCAGSPNTPTNKRTKCVQKHSPQHTATAKQTQGTFDIIYIGLCFKLLRNVLQMLGRHRFRTCKFTPHPTIRPPLFPPPLLSSTEIEWSVYSLDSSSSLAHLSPRGNDCTGSRYEQEPARQPPESPHCIQMQTS